MTLTRRELTVLLGLLAAVALVAAWLAPLPVPYDQDFAMLYLTNRAWLQGIALYDYPAQLAWVQATFGAEAIYYPYFYPPWYPLLTLFLGYFDPATAARLFFFVNLGLLALIWALAVPDTWPPRTRWLALGAAVLFMPSLGTLIVGQYTLPVMLGVALFVRSARLRHDWGCAAGLALMTFKPHLGALLMVTATLWLVTERRWGALGRALMLGAGLVGVGFLGDLAWPVSYAQSLMSATTKGDVQVCDVCASLPMEIAQRLTGEPRLAVAVPVMGVVALALAGLVLWRWQALPHSLALWLNLAVTFSLLLNPYMANYDYVLALYPLLWLAERGERLALIPYLAAFPMLALGRDWGDLVLMLGTGLGTLMLLIYTRSEKNTL